MIGKLRTAAIEELLQRGIIGHLGCQDNGTPYVVPISYAYDGQYIYCHSSEGTKIRMMRKNPAVCFQVEELKNMANWKSVILRGSFEELKPGDERNQAIQALLRRSLPIISSVTTHLGKEWPFSPIDIKEINRMYVHVLFTILE